MRVDVLTIFPSMFAPVLNESIIRRAREADKVDIRIHDLRDHTLDRHRKVDDRPYGGGPGMVMRPEPIFACCRAVLKEAATARKHRRILLMSPRGRRLNQDDCEKLAGQRHIVLICGRYEGVDERVAKYLADEEISIGDYVLTGGELAAMVVIDATVRLLPGVLGNEASAGTESFQDGRLEYPQYTRPEKFRGWRVPKALLRGDHAKIAAWRKKESLKITRLRRPDLLAKPDTQAGPATR